MGSTETMFKVVRHFLKSGRKLTIRRFALLSDAQAHCKNPETSSTTATSAAARKRTKRCGPWFDGYTEVP
jgi:hypothetical protein